MSSGMWVVVEWNQASHQPSIASGDSVYLRRDDAVEVAADLTAEAKRTGRREQFTVHELLDEGGDE